MKINLIIKEKRLALGLTQEQLANSLGVSTPAVNKWEKGSTYPDITLIPVLARLLKVDLNTLLSFKEDLSDKEIGEFTNDIVVKVNKDGFQEGYKMALDKIYEYPNCEKLILSVATVLQGCLYIQVIENKEEYEMEIEKLYLRLSNSEDIIVNNAANHMLINKHLNRGEVEKAQEYIDNLLDIHSTKKFLQGNLYIKSGDYNKALEVFEGELINSSNDIFSSLMQMLEIAGKEKRFEDARYFAEVIKQFTEIFDLWKYNSTVGYFQLAILEKNEDEFIISVKDMLDKMKAPWDISKSKLYSHIKTKSERVGEEFISNFIESLKVDKDNELEFVKDSEEFQRIINS